MNEFYSRFKALEDSKLFAIVLEPADYLPEAIAAARQILQERGLEEPLKAKVQEQQQSLAAQEEEEYTEVVKHAAYYKDLVNAKEHGVSFTIPLTEVPRFEGQLLDKGISFFKEDKNIGPGVDYYPTQKYFFDPEDSDAVDALVKKIEVNTNPYYSSHTGGIQMVGLIIAFLAAVLFIIGAIVFG